MLSTHNDLQTNAAYHADHTRASKSALDLIHRAPILYRRRYIDRTDVPKRTEALLYGGACHAYILQPEQFNAMYMVKELPKRTSAAGKNEYDGIMAEADLRGVEIIPPAWIHDFTGMEASILHHGAAQQILEGSEREVLYLWSDEATGVPCKLRADALSHGLKIVGDLKTCDDASPAGFRRSVFKYRYHVQAALYTDGLAANGLPGYGFVFIAVEKTAPHLVACYTLSEELIELGRQEYRADLQTLSWCRTLNQWPGYDNGIITINK